MVSTARLAAACASCVHATAGRKCDVMYKTFTSAGDIHQPNAYLTPAARQPLAPSAAASPPPPQELSSSLSRRRQPRHSDEPAAEVRPLRALL
jgi:hypothetical protein